MSQKTFIQYFFTGSVWVFAVVAINLAPQVIPVAATPSGTILHVIASAPGTCTGSWANACDLQTALTTAVSGDEIWVQMGPHKPDYSVTPDRYATFQMKNGVQVYGGFLGTEWLRSQRDWQTNVTILSGDIGVPLDATDNSYHVVICDYPDSTTILDGFTIRDGKADDSFVSQGAGIFCEYSDITLVNLTIKKNEANTYGAGMYNKLGNPTLNNVIFSQNTSNADGGGLYNTTYSNPTLNDVVFANNIAQWDGGGMYNKYFCNPTLTGVSFNSNSAFNGGGIANMLNSDAIIHQATFSWNSAGTYGGGMYNYGSNPKVTEALFENNDANNSGGGMYNYGSNPKLVNVRFISNSTDSGKGGGIYNSASAPHVINNIFNGNRSYYGAGMYNDSNSTPAIYNTTLTNNSAFVFGGGIYNNINTAGDPSIYNSIFWGNTAFASTDPDIYNISSAPTIYDSMLPVTCPAGATCNGNMLYGNPQFVDFNGADNIPGNADDNLHLTNASAAIDAGNNTNVPNDDNDLDQDINTGEQLPLDLDMLGRFIDNPYVIDTGSPPSSSPYVDMGCYESPLQVYLPLVLR